MKISVSGKGGSGKTTLAGTLARAFAGQGREVIAIDGDSNPNLAIALGLSAEQAGQTTELPEDLLVEAEDGNGGKIRRLTLAPAEIAERYGTSVNGGVRLLTMKHIEHAGKG